ncbi:MAG: PAS domain S-box protein [Acidiferrobacteraceae bacterium]
MALPGTEYAHDREGSRSARVSQAAALLLLLLSGLYLVHGGSRAAAPRLLLFLRGSLASCFVLSAIAIGLQTLPARVAHGAGRLCAAAVAFIGLDLLWIALRHEHRSTSAVTDAVIVVLGLALTIPRHRTRPLYPWLSDALPLVALLLMLPGVLGRLYHVPALDRFPFDSSLTGPYGTLGLIILALGTLALPPGGGVLGCLVSAGAGGRMTRRLLPAALLIPTLIGWAQFEGQRAQLFGPEVGVVLLTIADISLLIAIILFTACSLDRLDEARQTVLQHLQDANDTLEARVAKRTEDLATANQQLTKEVAERRRAEEQVRGFLESAPDAVLVTDLAGTIVLANHRAEHLLARPRNELLGHRIEEFVAPSARDTYLARRAEETSTRSRAAIAELLEVTMISGEGGQIETGMTMSVLRSGNQPLVFHDIRDIAWRKRTEHALKASETRFRAVADSANDAIISIDSRGTIIYSNTATRRLFGYEETELAASPITRLMPERHRRAHTEGLARAVETGESRITGRMVETEGRRKDGSEFPIELSLARWHAEGKTYFTGIIRDISVRRETEAKIVELNEALKARAIELEAVNTELEAFSYSVSHDLRAPLRSIDGFSQALAEDCADELSEAGKSHLGRIRAAAQRMGQLIDHLLKLSRVARAEITPETVDLTRMASEIANELTERTGRHVDFRVAEGLFAQGDPQLLRIALENLLSNAWKFTAGRADPEVEMGREEGADGIRFFVRDNGAGFDMTYAGKLFGAFQRLHDAREFPGTGIGLATVQRILRKHGGRIWAEATPGQGATFYFSL